MLVRQRGGGIFDLEEDIPWIGHRLTEQVGREIRPAEPVLENRPVSARGAAMNSRSFTDRFVATWAAARAGLHSSLDSEATR